MKDRKEGELERISRSCADGGAKPDRWVTQQAKSELRGRAERAVPVAAGADGSAVAAKRAERRTIVILAAAACLLILAVSLFLWALHSGVRPGALLLADGATYVSDEGLRQCTHEDEGAESPACLPWVSSEEIVCAREFALRTGAHVQAADTEEADTVLYRVEYRADDVSATVYIEAENIYLLSLGRYKRLPQEQSRGGVAFRTHTENAYTFVYFETQQYKYNLRLETTREEDVDRALARIAESL